VKVKYVPAFQEHELQFVVSRSQITSDVLVATLGDDEIEENRLTVLERGKHARYEEYSSPHDYTD
jgi:hypothetical protein